MHMSSVIKHKWVLHTFRNMWILFVSQVVLKSVVASQSCHRHKKGTVSSKINRKFCFRGLFRRTYSNPFLTLNNRFKKHWISVRIFKSGLRFWFCREVAEKVKNYNFCGNCRSQNLQSFAVILNQILENLSFSILFPRKMKSFPQSIFRVF